MATTVIHVRDMVDGDVYIGRAVPRKGLKASPWANPFRVENGDQMAAVFRFQRWLASGADPRALWILAHVHELRGKRLACFCKKAGQYVPCHGDVLKALADGEAS